MNISEIIEMELFIDDLTYEPGECVDGEVIIRIKRKLKLSDVYLVF